MPERPRRHLPVFGAAALTCLGVLAASCSSGAATATSTTVPASSVATVARRDIAQTKSETGTVGYGTIETIKLSGSSSAGAAVSTVTTTTAAPKPGAVAGATVASGASSAGVITSLPAVGSVVARNHLLAEVNGLPAAVLMYGDRPMWRALQVGVPAGPDVTQLETNLVALGYTGITVDATFSSSTAVAVEKWQKSLGLPQTGIVLRDDVVFEPSDVRISGQSIQPGDAATGPILTVTSTARVVTVTLAQTDAALGVPGTKVTITPASGPAVEGTVFAAQTQTATSTGGVGGGGGGASTTTTTNVTIVVPSGTVLPDGSVSVDFTTTQVTGALAVPVKALLALSEGGYAVEKVDGTSKKLVAVVPGQFANGFVEIKSGLAEGDRVIVPS